MSGQRAESLIDVDDSAFLSSLAKAFDEMEITSEAQLKKVAIEVQNKAKLYAAVDTGRMRSAINATVLDHDAEGAFIDVGVTLDSLAAAAPSGGKEVSSATDNIATNYAIDVEFGTSTMRAQPFMRPALAEVTGGDFAVRSGPPEIQG